MLLTKDVVPPAADVSAIFTGMLGRLPGPWLLIFDGIQTLQTSRNSFRVSESHLTGTQPTRRRRIRHRRRRSRDDKCVAADDGAILPGEAELQCVL